MSLVLERYVEQLASWPKTGRHLLAQHDAESIVVYQAYHPSIAIPAAREGRFVPPWSRARMSWIKPGFLWMMFRSGWGTKENQERVLAIRLRRAGFEEILRRAVHSSHVPEVYGDRAAWEARVSRSDVRLQWDPDHHPSGAKLERRAIQLGLHGEALARFADEWTLGIEDISSLVAEQREVLRSGELSALLTPRERPVVITEDEVARRLGVDPA